MTNDDERFERYLREAAADYESPRGEVPRDEMWAAIQAQRGEQNAPRLARSPARRWAWIGMAATLLLGVGIGRFAFSGRTSAPVAVNTPSDASAAPAVAAPPAQSVAARTSLVPTVSDTPSPTSAANAPYSVASRSHLQAVQLLLASYTAQDSVARGDSLLGAWARDLLRNTRLLLDSPAARDPQRARLLEDLEVILVQLVQQSAGADGEERAAIERTLRKTQIIPRLRSALPASLQSGTD